MNKNVSPAYAREYSEWIAKGQFDFQYQHAVPELREAIAKESPGLMALALGFLSISYYRRGVVDLLNDRNGWADIQCGYMAAYYAMKCEIKDGRTLHPRDRVELVLTLGFARLFKLAGDARWLEAMVAEHVDLKEIVGDVKAGSLLMESIINPHLPVTFPDLLKDRKQCCQKREAWPTRPTEIDPFGVIDIESMLRFPNEASFQYPDSHGFKPTPDAHVEEGIVAYHVAYE